jgi:hypothetical protein
MARYKNRGRNVKKTKKRRKFELLLIKRKVFEGLLAFKTPSEIQAELDIGPSTYRRCYKKICEELATENIVEAKAAKKKRLLQIEGIARESGKAWESSKGASKTKTTWKMVDCSECSGGKVDEEGNECPCCLGKGKNREEFSTTETEKGGDSTYLREQRLAIDLAAKIEGLSSHKVEHSMQGSIDVTHQAISKDNQLIGATDEELMLLKAVMDRGKQESGGDDIIDVEVLETENE